MTLMTSRRIGLAALLVTVFLLAAGCAEGSTSAEDRRRLAQLQTEPLLAQIGERARLIKQTDEAGRDTTNTQQHTTRVARVYRMTGDEPNGISIDLASWASDAGWTGQRNCFVESVSITAGKNYDEWHAALQIHLSHVADADEIELRIEISTPHVEDGETTPTRPPKPGGVQTQQTCA